MTDTPEALRVEGAGEAGSDAPPSLVGTVLSGRYRLKASLGEGGMGVVYEAEHTLMRKRLAVKVLHPEMMRLPEVVERFEREAMAAAHIEHPNVAAATDFGKLEDGSFFLVLEYVEGRSLRDELDGGRLAPRRALHIADQIVSALVRAHVLGIVHRDLKPENVMLVDRDGDPDFVKVLDFGIAKVPVSEISKEAGKQSKVLTKLGMVYGTPEYMAPEQALGQDVDARADLYSLGVLLYEMLSGRRPFESDSPVTLLGMQVTAAPPPFSKTAPDAQISEEFEVLVMELLEKEANARPSDAKQVRDAIEQLGRLLDAGDLLASTGALPAVRASTGIMPAPELPTRRASAFARSQPLMDLKERVEEGIEQAKKAVRPSRIRRFEADLRARMPAPLQTVPMVVWLGGVAVASVLGLGLGATLLCWAATPRQAEAVFAEEPWSPPAVSAAVAQASQTASAEELADARKKGVAGLSALLEKYPNDKGVLRALALTTLEGSKPGDAVALYARLFAGNPAMARADDVTEAVLKAAGQTKSADAAFELMEKHMGTAGPDLLYALAYEGKGTATSAKRAGASLKKDDILAKASPALVVATKLRTSGGCQAKYALLDDAAAHGDRRTFVQLRGLYSTKGCGFLGLGDCWKCMRSGGKLNGAIKAIEAREKGTVASPATSASN